MPRMRCALPSTSARAAGPKPTQVRNAALSASDRYDLGVAKKTPNNSRGTQSRRVTQSPRTEPKRGYNKRYNRRLFWTRVVAVLCILGLLLTLFGALLGPSF